MRFSFLFYFPWDELACSSRPILKASLTIWSTFTSMNSSSFKKPLIFSINHGSTLSWSAFSNGLTSTPYWTKHLSVFSFNPARCCLAKTLDTYFLWAALRSSLRAFCCTFLRSNSCLRLFSAASSLYASISSAFLTSSYSFALCFMPLSSSSSKTIMRAWSSVLLTKTFSIGSISASKSNSSGSSS